MKIQGTIVKFWHDTTSKNKQTVCQIGEVTGTARCHRNDMFNKVEGRKLAFKRALTNFTSDKETRTKFWEEYKNSLKYK